jgi:hypothetical protein
MTLRGPPKGQFSGQNGGEPKFKLIRGCPDPRSAAFRLPSAEQKPRILSPLCYIAARASRCKSRLMTLRD